MQRVHYVRVSSAYSRGDYLDTCLHTEIQGNTSEIAKNADFEKTTSTLSTNHSPSSTQEKWALFLRQPFFDPFLMSQVTERECRRHTQKLMQQVYTSKERIATRAYSSLCGTDKSVCGWSELANFITAYLELRVQLLLESDRTEKLHEASALLRVGRRFEGIQQLSDSPTPFLHLPIHCRSLSCEILLVFLFNGK